jgi:hypothetical protein
MIGLSMQPKLLLALRCKVCRQYMDSERVKEDRITAALFGAKKYAQCPCCGQIVNDGGDENYKARYRRFVKRMDKRNEER